MFRKLFGSSVTRPGPIYEAVWNGAVIAESGDIVRLEGNIYFPRPAVDGSHIAESETTTICPWKGRAHYFDVAANGKVNHDAAWHYPKPSPLAAKIKGRVAFWNGIEVRKKRVESE